MRVIAVEQLPGNDLVVRPSFLGAADPAVKHRLDAVFVGIRSSLVYIYFRAPLAGRLGFTPVGV